MMIKYKLDSAFGGVVNHSQIYEQAPELVQNLLSKIGEVVGLSASKTNLLTSQRLNAVENLASHKLSNKVELADSILPKITGETEIWVAGKLVTTTLLSKSKTLNEAAASLYDKNLAAILKESFVQDGIARLTNELLREGLSGSVLHAKVLEKLTAPIDKALKSFEYGGACFAAGTLVHTKEGLVPIEQIKVGDYVLSKPESGEGEQAYKRVTQTFAHAPTRVVQLTYYLDESRKTLDVLNTTLNHPFWIDSKGWTVVEDMHGTVSLVTGDDKLSLCDGRQVRVRKTDNVYISEQPGVGWLTNNGDGYRDYTGATGDLWDFVNYCVVALRVPALKHFEEVIELEDFEEGEDANSFYLKLPVYNLEVEDFHTYYVGKHGVWAHNKNGNGLEFTARGKLTPLAVEEQPFLSRAELKAHLLRNDIREGTFLTPAGSQSQAGLIAPGKDHAMAQTRRKRGGQVGGKRWNAMGIRCCCF